MKLFLRSKGLVLAVLLVGLMLRSMAQDTTLQRLLSGKADTLTVKELLNYGSGFFGADNRKAGKVFGIALETSRKLKYDFGIGSCYFKFGYLEGQEGRTREALSYAMKALPFFQKAGRIFGEVVCYNNIGYDYDLLGMADSAIYFYLEGIKRLEGRKDGVALLAALYENVGNLYGNRQERAKAIYYSKKGLEAAHAAGDTARIISASTGLSNVYVQAAEFSLALQTVREARKLLNPGTDPVLQAKVFMNMAAAYEALRQPDSAILAARTSMGFSREYDVQNYISAGLYLADAYEQKKDYVRQRVVLEELEKRGKEQKDVFLNLHEIFNRLAKLNYATGHYKEAYRYHDQYNQLKDSVFTRKSQDAMLEIETRYQTAQKEKELSEKQFLLSQQNLALEKSNRYVLLAVAGFLIACLLAAGGLLHARNKKKTYEARLLAFQKQKEVDMLQVLMQGEEKERSRIAKDLHDGVAGMLAAVKMHFSSLPTEGLLEAEGYQQGMKLLNEATLEVRKTSHNLMPELLLQQGLDRALRRYCNNISNSKLVIEYDSWGEIKRYKSSFELSVYRIVQELLNNILKHSKASQAMVQMSLQENVLAITVEDNGVGLAGNQPTGGMGFEQLHSRIKAMNGSIQVDSSPGNGMSAYLEFNVEGLEEAEAPLSPMTVE